MNPYPLSASSHVTVPLPSPSIRPFLCAVEVVPRFSSSTATPGPRAFSIDAAWAAEKGEADGDQSDDARSGRPEAERDALRLAVESLVGARGESVGGLADLAAVCAEDGSALGVGAA